MKKIILFGLMFMTSFYGFSQNVLAGWTFPTTSGAAPLVLNAACGTFSGSSAIYANGTNGSSTWTSDTSNFVFFGGAVPSPTLCSVSTATGALSLVNNANNGKSIVIKSSTLGYKDITMTYNTRGTGTGFSDHLWEYSFDGSSFTTITTITGRTSTSYSLQTILDGTNAALTNKSAVYIRLTVTGASGASGNNRLDNINLTGTAMPVGPDMSSATCGANFDVNITEIISSELVSGATNYRFKFVKADLSEFIVERPVGSVAPLGSIRVAEFAAALGASFEYGATYTVSAQAEVASEWTAFGNSCTFSVTNDPRTKLRDTACNQVISGIGTNVFNDVMPLATNYRFRVTRLTDNAQVIFDRNVNRFNLLTHAPSIASDNTTYNVEVAFEYNSNFSNYGTICTITTAHAPLALRNDFCDVNLTNIGANIFATALSGATEYTFLVRNQTTLDETEVVTPNRWLNLVNSGLNPTYGTNYRIRVKVEKDGVYNNYGLACNVTTPALPAPKLRSDFCNQTLATLGTNIFSESVTFGTKYGFEVTSPDASVTEVIKSNRWFNLVSDGFNPTNGQTYSVRVKVEINGVYTAYGASCNVSTPAAMTLLNQNIGLETSNEIVVYPNPFTDQFTVKLADLNMANIQVFDINGRLVENLTTNDTFEVEMGQNLNTGVYFVRVEQSGENQTFKMIKK